jgi:hypothetical protein
MSKKLINISQAKAIESSDKIRSEKCQQEVARILNFYECDMIPVLTVTPGMVQGDIVIVAKPREK